jgi:hypothetical protein
MAKKQVRKRVLLTFTQSDYAKLDQKAKEARLAVATFARRLILLEFDKPRRKQAQTAS